MKESRKINVFWWSSVEFEGKPYENFGDILSKYLVEKISGKVVKWVNPERKNWNPFRASIFTTTGSILKHVSKDCIVWGSGIISKKDDVAHAKFLAVRGPETFDHLVKKGFQVDKVFGDPAIVLPQLYMPKQKVDFKLGIIPHYVDHQVVSNWYQNDANVKVIDLLNDDIEGVVDEILSCEQIISSSLHGVIVSHSYNKPAIWSQFSKKLSGDNIKFVDYFKSVNLQTYEPLLIDHKLEVSELIKKLVLYPNLPEKGIIENLANELMEVCPFKSKL